MSIEDIDFLKKNSTKENYLFLVDSKKRDFLNYPDPNNYTITFDVPFKNVIGIEVIDASIPRTMYTIDKYNNTIYYYIASGISEYNGLINNGTGLSKNFNTNIFKKLEIPPGNYTIQTFIPMFNSLMIKGSQTPEFTGIYSPISIINYSNPSELSNKIIFTCKNPFILDMGNSSLAETIGCCLNIDSSNDGILYKYFNSYNGNPQLLKMYHSILNPISGLYEITTPGIVFLIGEKYIVIRSPEIEEHAFGSMAYNNYNQGIAKFKVSGIGFNDEKVELTKIPTREFHPIGKLSKITFRFETADGNPYDFKGINHTVTYLIKYYKPKLINAQEFKPLLNPNYKSDFNEYRSINDDQQLSDEEDKNEYSRDHLLERFKYNELLIKKEIEEEDDEEDD